MSVSTLSVLFSARVFESFDRFSETCVLVLPLWILIIKTTERLGKLVSRRAELASVLGSETLCIKKLVKLCNVG